MEVRQYLAPADKDGYVVHPSTYTEHNEQYYPGQQHYGGSVTPKKGAGKKRHTKHDPKCDLPIPDGVILPYSSGAPYPPALDEFYLPVSVNTDTKKKGVKKQSKPPSDKPPTADQKGIPVDEWGEAGPTYTFIRAASENLFQRAVPQDLASQKSFDNDQGQTINAQNNNNGWVPMNERTYNSYTFPCKGKADGFYPDVNLSCEVSVSQC